MSSLQVAWPEVAWPGLTPKVSLSTPMEDKSRTGLHTCGTIPIWLGAIKECEMMDAKHVIQRKHPTLNGREGEREEGREKGERDTEALSTWQPKRKVSSLGLSGSILALLPLLAVKV